jgi:hypothetical protein
MKRKEAGLEQYIAGTSKNGVKMSNKKSLEK